MSVDGGPPAADFQQIVFGEVEVFFDPIVVAAHDLDSLVAFFDEFGWDAGAVLGNGVNTAAASAQAAAKSLDAVRAWATKPAASLGDVAAGFADAGKAFALARRVSAPPTNAPPAFTDLPVEVLESLLARYLLRRAPAMFRLLALLTLIEQRQVPAVAVGNRVVRGATTLLRFHLEAIPDLVSDPLKRLRQEYAPDGFATQNDVNAVAYALFPRIAELLHELGVDAVVGRGSGISELPPAREANLAGVLTAARTFATDDLTLEVGTTVRLVSIADGGPGVLLAPFGEVILRHGFGSWYVELDVTGGVGAVAIKKTGVEIVPADGATPSRVDVGLLIARISGAGPALMVGAASGTRLEVGQLEFHVDGSFAAAKRDFGLSGLVGHAVFVVSGGDGDGFLAKVLPRDGLKIPFDLGIGWSTTKGFYFLGSADLHAQIPVHKSLGDVVKVETITLGLEARAGTPPQTTGLEMVVAASATVKLGPVTAAIDRVGIRSVVGFPLKGDGNLGLADVKLEFKPPTGAGLSIDSAAVKGGGFLSFNDAQYAGTLHLDIEGISLNAIGILTTRLPGGRQGFSLLILISASGFTPVQLGFGFSLTGVGGLIGINRDVSTPALQAGLKSHALDSILLSKDDPVPRAAQIIQQLETIFPPTPDSYVFGPTAQISWGTPTILTIDVALLIRLPAPVRLYVLGRLRAFMPTEKEALVKLNMDVLGVVDFGKGTVAIDAILYDSKILAFALTGGMALRASWGESPGFALAVGGFNPRFVRPPGFPSLDRLALTLSTGDNPRLRVEAYLAITSNTVQFGANADFRVALGDLALAGGFGFDALIQLAPFEFVVDIRASLALTYKGAMLMAVAVNLTLSGPAPMRARGSVSFTILFLTISKSFDVTLVEGQKPAGPEAIDLWADALREELSDPRSWAAQLPEGGQMVAIAASPAPADGELLCHPVGRIAVHQRVVPFERDLDRFGPRPLKGSRRFAVNDISVNGVSRKSALSPAYDQFAPAQFRNMSDDQKLKAPSFERMVAGAAVEGGVAVGLSVPKTVGYETIIVRGETTARGPRFTPPADRVPALAQAGAAATAATRTTGRAKYRNAKLDIKVGTSEYVVGTKSGLHVAAKGDGTYTGALEALRTYAASHPTQADDLQVVRVAEVV